MNPEQLSLDDYTLFCRGQLANPYPLYHRLRAEEPVHWSDLANSWVLTRYDDVKAVLHYGPHLTAERLSPLINQLPMAVRIEVEELRAHLATWMQYYDPPDHRRLRALVSKAFTPRMLERLRPQIQQVVDELIDEVMARPPARSGGIGTMEMIQDLAFPLPAIVISEMLGVPPKDRAQFKHWTDDIAEFLEGVSRDFPAVARRTQQSVHELADFLRGLFTQRRKAPQEDLISALLVAEEQGEHLSEAEMLGMCSFVLQAGHETTTGLLSNGLLALLRHPKQMDELKRHPTRIETTVEEMLRYDSPIQRISRVALQDFELGGKQIRAGQRLWAMQGAANRDPAHFPQPDRFDIARSDNRHVAFGYGIHFCLGAPLARLEGQIAFNTLLRRLPNLRLAEVDLVWQEGVSLRRLKRLPVNFDAEPNNAFQ